MHDDKVVRANNATRVRGSQRGPGEQFVPFTNRPIAFFASKRFFSKNMAFFFPYATVDPRCQTEAVREEGKMRIPYREFENFNHVLAAQLPCRSASLPLLADLTPLARRIVRG